MTAVAILLVRGYRRLVSPFLGATALGNPRCKYHPSCSAYALEAYRGRLGETLYFEVTGSLQGHVWGTDTYTDDSALAAAVVHAGVLAPGQRGVVGVIMLSGADAFPGSTRHGITSHDYGAWGSSYRIIRVQGP